MIGATGRRRTWARRVFSSDLSLARIEWPVLLVALVLLGVGMTFVREMSLADVANSRGAGSFGGHVKKAVVSLPLLVLGLFLRPRWLSRNAFVIYGMALVLLALVPFIGEERNFARRWIPFPLIGFDLQPSELAKVALVIALARAFSRNRLETLNDWVVPGVLALLPMGMVALQPDLGTAVSIVPVTLGMMYLAGASGRALVALALLVGLLGGAVWQFELVQEYQVRRIDTWAASFDAESLIANRNGAAFHAYHNRVSIGNGGWQGTGLGHGIANQAGHLPERECDSIFAVIAEEGGFVGVAATSLLYVLLVILLLWISSGIRDRFARLAVGGIGLSFGAHFFIHAGVNLGLVPMTGLTLPLVSTGGSSLFTTFLALGVALGLRARWEPQLHGDAFRA